MVRTGNVDFSCKRLTSNEIRKSKYHIIRTPPPLPPRKISGSALEQHNSFDNPYSLVNQKLCFFQMYKILEKKTKNAFN